MCATCMGVSTRRHTVSMNCARQAIGNLQLHLDKETSLPPALCNHQPILAAHEPSLTMTMPPVLGAGFNFPL